MYQQSTYPQQQPRIPGSSSQNYASGATNLGYSFPNSNATLVGNAYQPGSAPLGISPSETLHPCRECRKCQVCPNGTTPRSNPGYTLRTQSDGTRCLCPECPSCPIGPPPEPSPYPPSPEPTPEPSPYAPPPEPTPEPSPYVSPPEPNPEPSSYASYPESVPSGAAYLPSSWQTYPQASASNPDPPMSGRDPPPKNCLTQALSVPTGAGTYAAYAYDHGRGYYCPSNTANPMMHQQRYVMPAQGYAGVTPGLAPQQERYRSPTRAVPVGQTRGGAGGNVYVYVDAKENATGFVPTPQQQQQQQQATLPSLPLALPPQKECLQTVEHRSSCGWAWVFFLVLAAALIGLALWYYKEKNKNGAK